MNLHSFKDMSNLRDILTVIMPVRLDSKERMDNLKAVLQHISCLDCRVIVLEADKTPVLKEQMWMKEEFMRFIEYRFKPDDAPIFHRTKYINQLLSEATTEIVAVWDADILVSYRQIKEAVVLINQGCTIAYPYNGEYVMLSDIESNSARRRFDTECLKNRKLPSVFGRPFCGGVFLVHRQRYIKCGGENEHFTGWGPEDAERLRRVSILGYVVKWTKEGQAYHLYHPRGKNSNFYTDKDAIRLRMELVKVCSMDKEELQNYITEKTWKQ